MLGQYFQALAAVVEHGRGRESHMQVIQRMAPQVAIPGVPGGPRCSVGIAGVVTLAWGASRFVVAFRAALTVE